MDNNEILDTLKHAQEYVDRLQALDSELDKAKSQISDSCDEAKGYVEDTFTELLSSITEILDSRRDKLLLEIEEIRQSELKPLLDCHEVVSKKLSNTSDLIKLGNFILETNASDQFVDFNNRSSKLGSLPEVPELKDVSCVSFQFEQSQKKDLLRMCSKFGCVSPIPPVQICSVSEKPGAILVEWQIRELDEQNVDVQEFSLQRAFGNVNKDAHLFSSFFPCYKGTDTQYLVKDVVPNQEYSFRVCCKFEGSSEWSCWSLPQVASTNLKAFNWKNNSDFQLLNENKIAKPLVNSPQTLFCDASHFQTGCSVEFIILECDDEKNNTFLGLFAFDDSKLSHLDTGTFLIEASGNIYIDGVKKSTQLPVIQSGTKVSFTCEQKAEKLRINVDVTDKTVTYDWINNEDRLYFGAIFNSTKWKVMIE